MSNNIIYFLLKFVELNVSFAHGRMSESEAVPERYKGSLEYPNPVEAEVQFVLHIGKEMINFDPISGVNLECIQFFFRFSFNKKSEVRESKVMYFIQVERATNPAAQRCFVMLH
ncbi:hypothetical protein AVEN_46027-1 [Araneus ventricosus]|uniref:Uncharacterized protein n=1 Tax=Araneus ventricosus TaxID=182803 RepID=A0A4Y2M073_ARAVE|nr:hypothetical protein AVEN_46027-1 [Araneus ventricosus]